VATFSDHHGRAIDHGSSDQDLICDIPSDGDRRNTSIICSDLTDREIDLLGGGGGGIYTSAAPACPREGQDTWVRVHRRQVSLYSPIRGWLISLWLYKENNKLRD
jgi:hypothetical protein